MIFVKLNLFFNNKSFRKKNTCAFEKKLVKTRNKVTSKPARPGTTSGSTKKLIEATNTKVAHMKW